LAFAFDLKFRPGINYLPRKNKVEIKEPVSNHS
jgi:hypothetical protein